MKKSNKSFRVRFYGAGRLTISLLFLAGSVSAFDVGLPGEVEENHHNVQIEVVGELFKRDIIQEIANTRRTFEGEQDEQRWFGRVCYPLGTRWHVNLALGGTYSEDSEGYVPLVGAGFDYAAVQRPDVQIYIFGGAFYSDEITYKSAGFEREDGVVVASSERLEKYVETALGIRLCRKFEVDDKAVVAPYVGIQFSVVQAEGKETYEFRNNPELEDFRDNSVDFEQDGFLGAHVGMRVTLASGINARVESRIIDQRSISVALGYQF